MALSEKTVLETLKQVYDPEIPVDIVNLGLVYGIDIEGDRVRVRVTVADPGCSVGDFIAAEAKRVLRMLEGVREVMVELVYEPPWSMERISVEGRKVLGWV